MGLVLFLFVVDCCIVVVVIVVGLTLLLLGGFSLFEKHAHIQLNSELAGNQSDSARREAFKKIYSFVENIWRRTCASFFFFYP